MEHDDNERPSFGRRDLGALLGILGAGAALAVTTGCAQDGEALPETTSTTSAALSGLGGFLWADTLTDLRTRIGTDTSSSSSPAIVMGGYTAPGDGGGGVFYWDKTSSTGDNGGTIIVPTGSSSGRWIRVFSGPLNVKWFGAGGIGGDDTAAIRRAIAAVTSTTGGSVYLPAGTYGISSTIVISGYMGLILQGDGFWATLLQPTTAVAGTPVIQFVNSRDCIVEKLGIQGFTGHAPSCGIESRKSASPAVAPTNLTVRHVQIGSESSASIVNGVQYEADPGQDANNDNGFFEELAVVNFTNAAIYIGHANSLVHRIVGGGFGGGPIGVQLAGGSFQMIGTNLSVSSTLFQFLTPVGNGTPGYYHETLITGVVSEGGTCVVDSSTSTQPVLVSLSCCELETGAANVDVVSFNSGTFTAVDTLFNTGQPATMHFADANSVATICSCELIVETIFWNGTMKMIGNNWTPGLVTLSPGPTAVLMQAFENGGQIPRDMVSYTPSALPPTSGSWNHGDRIRIAQPVAGGPEGWVCVVAGGPGTWKTYGVIGT